MVSVGSPCSSPFLWVSFGNTAAVPGRGHRRQQAAFSSAAPQAGPGVELGFLQSTQAPDCKKKSVVFFDF